VWGLETQKVCQNAEISYKRRRGGGGKIVKKTFWATEENLIEKEGDSASLFEGSNSTCSKIRQVN